MLRFRSFSASKMLAQGRKTTLREFSRADVDRWLEWPRHADPLYSVFNAPPMTTRQRDSYWASQRQSSTSRLYAVEDFSGVLVGRIGLREIDWYALSAVLGVSFRSDRLGEGLGTDAMQVFLSFFFGPLGMDVLFLDVAAYNQRARRCYERCGFRHLGEHWGEAGPDLAGVFRDPGRADLRPFFRWEHGLARPLLYDMVLRRAEFERRQNRNSSPSTTETRRARSDEQ
jgi:diamine N-acetyltransferase